MLRKRNHAARAGDITEIQVCAHARLQNLGGLLRIAGKSGQALRDAPLAQQQHRLGTQQLAVSRTLAAPIAQRHDWGRRDLRIKVLYDREPAIQPIGATELTHQHPLVERFLPAATLLQLLGKQSVCVDGAGFNLHPQLGNFCQFTPIEVHAHFRRERDDSRVAGAARQRQIFAETRCAVAAAKQQLGLQ